MAVINVGSNNKNVYADVVEPDAQTSTDSYVVVEDSGIDARPRVTLSYTVEVITNDIDWRVFGANQSDYSDEVEVHEATVTAGNNGGYATNQAPYSYYRVKIKSNLSGNHGAVTVSGIAKG